mgnify:FL=1
MGRVNTLKFSESGVRGIVGEGLTPRLVTELGAAFGFYQGGGRIVNMSSVAAPIAIPFQAYYSASKAAVRTYTLALASEVRPFGIEVCVIMPGDIATGFTAARRKSCDGDDVYHGRIARSVAVMERDERTGMSAQFAGQFVARRATQKHPKLICTMGRKYALFVFLMRILPTRTATRIVGKIYAS